MGAAASIGDDLDLTSADIRLREKLKAELFQTNGGFSPDTLLCAFRKFDQVRGQTWVILDLISYIQDHDNVLSNDEFRMVLSELGCDLDEQQVAQIVQVAHQWRNQGGVKGARHRCRKPELLL